MARKQPSVKRCFGYPVIYLAPIRLFTWHQIRHQIRNPDLERYPAFAKVRCQKTRRGCKEMVSGS